MSHFKGYPVSERAKYKLVVYDDIGLIALTALIYGATTNKEALKLAVEEITRIYKSGKISNDHSCAVLKFIPGTRYKGSSWVRLNPVATAVVGTAPATAAPATVTNPCGTRRNSLSRTNGRRISLREWITRNREEIDKCIRRVAPGIRINDTERRLWILNDEGLYRWARSEGANV